MSYRKPNRLALFGRPKTIFDPKIRQHREIYAQYLKTGSWAHSPLSFVIDDDSLAVTFCIEKKMLDHYLKKEFGKDVKYKLLEMFDE